MPTHIEIQVAYNSAFSNATKWLNHSLHLRVVLLSYSLKRCSSKPKQIAPIFGQITHPHWRRNITLVTFTFVRQPEDLGREGKNLLTTRVSNPCLRALVAPKAPASAARRPYTFGHRGSRWIGAKLSGICKCVPGQLRLITTCIRRLVNRSRYT